MKNSLWHKYIKAVKDLNVIEEGMKFITYRMVGNLLEIHDVYSEEGLKPLMEMAFRLERDLKPEIVEGYIDLDYIHFDRSDYMLRKYGMAPYKKTEDYLYYRKVINE